MDCHRLDDRESVYGVGACHEAHRRRCRWLLPAGGTPGAGIWWSQWVWLSVGVRPFLRRRPWLEIHALRFFRHRERNLYGADVEQERTRDIAIRARRAWDLWKADLERFLTVLGGREPPAISHHAWGGASLTRGGWPPWLAMAAIRGAGPVFAPRILLGAHACSQCGPCGVCEGQSARPSSARAARRAWRCSSSRRTASISRKTWAISGGVASG